MSILKIFLGLTVIVSFSAPSFSQTKPAESTTKLKKVLHFTKCGGWLHVDGQKDMTDILNVLAKKKGFTVVHSADATLLNLTNLKTYNAIIWDNNVDGGASVPDVAARQAVLDYTTQGGGWLLVHGAGDHKNSWAALLTTLGTTFSTHGDQGAGDFTFDAEAKNHKELKYMLQGLPAMARFTRDEWYAFQNTVRGKPGVVVIGTAGNGLGNVLLPYADGSSLANRTYAWAKEMGVGRSLYTAIGHGGNQLYAQADSFATKAIYENLRYVAGDYQNGCTNRNATNFNAAARVDDGTCTPTGLTGRVKSFYDLEVSFTAFKGQTIRLPFPHAGKYSLELRNATGEIIWLNAGLENNVAEISAPLLSGVYYLKAINGKNRVSQKVVLL